MIRTFIIKEASFSEAHDTGYRNRLLTVFEQKLPESEAPSPTPSTAF